MNNFSNNSNLYYDIKVIRCTLYKKVEILRSEHLNWFFNQNAGSFHKFMASSMV